MKKFSYLSVVLIFCIILSGCDLIFGNKKGNGKGSGVSGDEVEIQIPVTGNQPAEANPPVFKEKGHIKNVAPKVDFQLPYYSYDDSGKFSVDYTCESNLTYKGKPVLKVTPKGNGLEITKYHNPIWYYVDIYVFNVTEDKSCPQIVTEEKDNKNEAADTYFYPFVRAGDLYKIYIIKQDMNYQNWTTYENDAVYVTAIGGEGNVFLSSNKYEYDEKTSSIVFENLSFTMPEKVYKDGSVGGGIYGNQLWSGDNIWPSGYKFKDSALCLSDNNSVKKFISGRNKITVSLRYEYNYYDSKYKKTFSYSLNFLEGTIYEASINESEIISLEGNVVIPKVYLTTYDGWSSGATHHFGDEWCNAIISVEDTDGKYNLGETSIKIKDRGNSTKWTDKTPFSIKFDTKTPVLGMKKAKRWVLMANYYDRSLIRTQLASYLGNNVFNSYWNASFTPVNLYINDEFVGSYDLGECNKINSQRIDIQSLADYADKKSDYKDVNGDDVVDINDAGFMVEIDTAINSGNMFINKYNYKTEVGVSDWGGAERIFFYSAVKCLPMTLKEPDFDDSKYSDSECLKYGKYAKSKIDAFEKMLFSSSFKSRYTDYIDPISFIDWYLVNEFSKNSDANFQKSVPVTYNAATGKLYMGPNWDFDLAFGNFNHSYELPKGYSTVEDPAGWYIYGGRKGCNENDLYCEVNNTDQVQCWWINRLMESGAFKKAVKERWNDRKIFLKNAINVQITEYANRLYDSMPENEAIIPRLGQESWNGPSGYAKRTEYEDEITYLYNWCQSRYQWMDKEINKW